MLRFRGASFRLLHNPLPADIAAHLSRLKQAGCNAVSVIPHHYCDLEPGTPNFTVPQDRAYGDIYPDFGLDSTHPFQNTPRPELVHWTLMEAYRQGLATLLKPHIDSYNAAWRGDISVAENQYQFSAAYADFIHPYAEMAYHLPGTILCIGTELYTVTKDLGVDFWIALAERLHADYPGLCLTYAANWGWEEDAEYNRLAALWPHLDYVGVDAYFPLVPADGPDNPDVDTLVAGWHRRGVDADWCPRIDDDLLRAATDAGKPLLFTEIGYANRLGAAKEPGRDSQQGDVPSDEAQANAAQAARLRWAGETQFAGWFWWEAWLGQQQPISHDVLGRPAEPVVFGP